MANHINSEANSGLKRNVLKQLFVSNNGDDKNEGTIDKPFKSLNAARDYIRQSSIRGGFTVYIRGGVYEIDETFELNSLDSGTSDEPNIYKAYDDEEVRLVGGKYLKPEDFIETKGLDILSRLPEESHENVFQIDLKKIGITDYGQIKQNGHCLTVTSSPLELYYNDEIMTLARYPNSGFIQIGEVVDKGSVPRIGDYSERGAIFKYTDNRHERWVNSEDVWFHGTFNNGYADDLIKVESIDTDKKQVKLSMPHLYGVDSGHPYQHYVAVNLLEELDVPGEWYLDRGNGILHFWPPEGLERARIAVSILEEPIIALEDVCNIKLENLIIEIGRGIGVYVESGENNCIEGCIIRNLGTAGILIGKGAKQTFPHNTHDDYDGVPISRQVGSLQAHLYKNHLWDREAGKNHKVKNCEIYNTGSGGVILSGGSKKDLISGNCEVVNCKIYDYNRRNKFQWGGVNVDGCGNRVANCEIYNSDFMAIYVKGNDHIFEYNNIHHVTRDCDDCSAWYMGRDPSDRGNIIRYNYFHDIGRDDRRNMCIYCDDLTCDLEVYGNIFYRVYTNRGLVFSNAGQDIKVINNIAIDCPVPFAEISSFLYIWGIDFIDMYFGAEGIITKRLSEVDYLNPPYSLKYPELIDYLDMIVENKEWIAMRPRRNVLKGNIICHLQNREMLGGEALKYDERGNLMDSHETMKIGYKIVYRGEYAQFADIDNYELSEDIGFKDTEKCDFTLEDDSIVFKYLPEFEKINFTKIGVIKD